MKKTIANVFNRYSFGLYIVLFSTTASAQDFAGLSSGELLTLLGGLLLAVGVGVGVVGHFDDDDNSKT